MTGISGIIEVLGRMFEDGLFAAVAAIGFGAVSQPSRRGLKWIALLGAIGHMVRYIAMHYVGLDIVFGSFAGSLAIGFVALAGGARERIPVTCLYIPSLLPMIPGIYAYKTVFSLILFLQSVNGGEVGDIYMNDFFLNATVTVGVVFMLGIGAAIPLFVFKKKAVSMTREKV